MHLSPATYPAIRAAIDTSLTAESLSDATIALPIYAPAAAAEVTRRAPTTPWADADGVQAALLEAAILLAAARLVPAVPLLAAETTAGQHSYTRLLQKPQELADQLRQRGEAALTLAHDLATEAVPVPAGRYEPPVFFSLARRRRS